MHEFDLAKRIADIAIEKARKAGLKRINSIKLRVGRMASAEVGMLETLIRQQDPMLESVSVEIEFVDVKLSCPCGKVYADERFEDDEFAHSIAHMPLMYSPKECPACHKDNSKIISGQEFDLIELSGDEL